MASFSTELTKVSEPSPHVLLVEFSRKPVNAFSKQLWTEYGQILDNISTSGQDVRAVILGSSLPKIFAAGIDFQALVGGMDEQDEDPARRSFGLQRFIKDFQDCIQAPERCPVPVIAAVHGPVIGLGIDIITACDVRIAASSATFCIKEVDIGLAADMGTLAHIAKVSGNASLARELAFTARTFSTSEAMQLGLLSKVVQGGREEVINAALEIAKVIASKSPVAVVGTKKLMLHARDHTVAQNLDYTATWNSAMVNTEDIVQAVTAAQAKPKKSPEFRGMKGSAKL